MVEKIFADNIKEILYNSCDDFNEEVRPSYADGTKAHSKYITQVFEKYSIENNEFPITSLRPIAWKSGIKEILWIYKDASNDLELLKNKYNVTWWDSWDMGDKSIGQAYGARFYDPAHEIQLVYYETLMDKMLAQPDSGAPWVKTVLAGSWDNTARKGLKANIFHGCTPALYERWLREAARHAQARPALPGKPMVFINAWNEWAEGVYLEPDRKFGYALLAATQRVAYGLPPQG